MSEMIIQVVVLIFTAIGVAVQVAQYVDSKKRPKD